MSTTLFRAGVVGTGWWAELEHLPGLRARADVEVAAICGRNPERLAAGQWQTVTRERTGGAVDGDEDCSFLAQLANGAQGVFQASKLVAGRANFQRVELHGDQGSLVYEAEPGIDPTWERRLWAGRPDRTGLVPVALPPEIAAGLDAPDNQAGRREAYRRLTDPFFDAIRGGGASSPDFRDGAAVQAVLDAVAASAEKRRWVDVDGYL